MIIIMKPRTMQHLIPKIFLGNFLHICTRTQVKKEQKEIRAIAFYRGANAIARCGDCD